MSVMSRDIKIAYLEEIGWFEPTQAEQFKPKEVIGGVTRGVGVCDVKGYKGDSLSCGNWVV